MKTMQKAAKAFAPVSNKTAESFPNFICGWWFHKREVPAKLANKFEVENKKK